MNGCVRNHATLPCENSVMDTCFAETSTDELIQEIENLEDSYAEALKDDIDVASLSGLWSHIKTLKKELHLRMNS